MHCVALRCIALELAKSKHLISEIECIRCIPKKRDTPCPETSQ
jgi:hypothetical protein